MDTVAPHADRSGAGDVGCGIQKPLTEAAAPCTVAGGKAKIVNGEEELQWSTIHDISVVRSRKKNGKYKTNVVVVGGRHDDEVPLESVSSKIDDRDLSFVTDTRGVKPSSVAISRSTSCPSGSSYEVLSVDELEYDTSDDNDLISMGKVFPCDPNRTEINAVSSGIEAAITAAGGFASDDSGSNGCVPSSSVVETDAFDGDGENSTSQPDDGPPKAGANAPGKRNRQMSTDSCGSASAADVQSSRKANKKAKKKNRPKTADCDDIDRILAELAVDDCRISSSQPNITKETQNVEPHHSLPVGNVASSTTTNSNRRRRKKKPKENIRLPVSDSEVHTNDGSSPEVLDSKVQMFLKQAESSLDFPKKESETLGAPNEDSSKPSDTGKRDGRKDRKKPSKKQLEVIHLALRKAKEDEEKFLEEERLRQMKLEEAEKLRLEMLKREQERKERKKQKEKDKRERLKAQGKLLTKSQKLARARVEAALSAWREHGVDVPQVRGKKSDAKSGVTTQQSRDHQRRRTESDGEPVSLMSTSSLSTDTDDLSSMLPTGSSEDVTNVLAGEISDAKQRHLSDPIRDGGKESYSRDCVLSGEMMGSGKTGRLRANSAGCCKSDRVQNLISSSKIRQLSESGMDSYEGSLRSPVVCVLGHVDTGKTKILDKIRKTHVQDGEAGGITQQIGATMIPKETIKEKCRMLKSFNAFSLEIPGLLVIDTPGHESFRNLRSRGSSLCDIAVLVVDIMHGLEQQTIESIELLKQRKTPFVVALNKIDRLYCWQGSGGNDDIEDVVKWQGTTTSMEFDKKCKHVIAEFAGQGLNAALCYENSDPRSYISMVPLSAITGDGMGNLLSTVSYLCQTMMYNRLTFSEKLKATVLEVKTLAGLGTTIDVILVDGFLRESDTIVVAGQDGPIVTQIRSILMPQPLRELRVKNPYQEHKIVKGSQGVKLCGKDLDRAIAGLPLFVVRRSDDVHDLKEKMNRIFRSTINSIKVSERGVYVQASTLGSLEALLDFLKSSGIPYAGVKVGPVVKKDVMRASVMLEHDVRYAVILAFDVKVERDAQDLADHVGIKIFQADIIYHLFDRFTEYQEKLAEKKKNDLKKFFVLPCKLSVLPDVVISVRDPIVIGVRVTAGVLKIGTPLCVPSKNFLDLGVVGAIQVRDQSLDCAKEGDEVCVRIESCGDQAPKTFGKHFDQTDLLVSKITRQTIDVCKEYYRADLRKSDWQLMVELKKVFLIV